MPVRYSINKIRVWSQFKKNKEIFIQQKKRKKFDAVEFKLHLLQCKISHNF